MTRSVTFGVFASALLVAGAASGQTRGQSTPPASQTPPASSTPQRPTAPPPATAPSVPAQTTPTPPKPAVPVPFPADAKMGFVNMQQVVAESILGKAGSAKAKALNDSKVAEITAKNTAVQKMQQEIQSNQTVWSATVLSQKNSELAKAQNDLQFMQQQAQTDVDALQQDLFDDFLEKVLPICEELRAEKNLWVIWNLGQGSNVTAVHPGLDLSAEIVKRLDAKFPK